jgi:hypothetical protein
VKTFLEHDNLNLLVNFIEENVSRLSIGRQCSGSQTNVSDPPRAALAAIVQGQAHA